MTNPNVLVVGDLGVDTMIKVSSLLLQEDSKYNGERVAQGAGGMAANVAVGLARLNATARLVAAVGDDFYASLILKALDREGVDISCLHRRPHEPTFACIVLIAASGEKALIRLPSDAYLPRSAEITQDIFVGMQHLHTTVGSETLCQHAIKMAKEYGLSVSVDLEAADIPADPKVTRNILQDLDILFINKASRQQLSEHLGLRPIAGPRMIVTTLGQEGSMCEVGDESYNASGYAVSVKDTTGAGDAFAAAFLCHYLRFNDVANSLEFANAAAALSTCAYGAQAGLQDYDAVTTFLNQQNTR